MNSALKLLKYLFHKKHCDHVMKNSVITEYLAAYRDLNNRYKMKEIELTENKKARIENNEGIESLFISQEYELKLFLLRKEREKELDELYELFNTFN